MAQVAVTAEAQLDELRRHYAAKYRPEAIERLANPVEKASAQIERGASGQRPYPATYREIAVLNMQWVKVYRYWFGYADQPDGKVIFNVFYDTADIRRRVKPGV